MIAYFMLDVSFATSGTSTGRVIAYPIRSFFFNWLGVRGKFFRVCKIQPCSNEPPSSKYESCLSVRSGKTFVSTLNFPMNFQSFFVHKSNNVEYSTDSNSHEERVQVAAGTSPSRMDKSSTCKNPRLVEIKSTFVMKSTYVRDSRIFCCCVFKVDQLVRRFVSTQKLRVDFCINGSNFSIPIKN